MGTPLRLLPLVGLISDLAVGLQSNAFYESSHKDFW
jgi:hypothetical protein